MSFDRLSSLESQPTTTRRQDDPTYRDDPEFQRFTESLSTKLFELISNISRLSNQLSKKDTERGRERIHDLLEETRDGFKEVGDGVKRAQSWSDLNVGTFILASTLLTYSTALTAIYKPKTVSRVCLRTDGIPSGTTESY